MAEAESHTRRRDCPRTLTTRIAPDFLATFERFQETYRIYAVDPSGQLYQKDEHYIDEWDDTKKQQVIEILNYYIDRGGVVVAIQNDKTLLGFAGLDGHLLGTDDQYLNLGFIHVSLPFRGQGIGMGLFERVCRQQSSGVRKNYTSERIRPLIRIISTKRWDA